MFLTPFIKHTARLVVGARMAVSANGDKIVRSVGSAEFPIDDMVRLKDFALFPTHLTGVFVPRKNEIPNIVKTVALPMLVVHTADLWVDHLRHIELPNLDVELGIRQQGRKLVNPEEGRVDSGLKARWQPALWFSAVQESRFSVASFSVSPASPECRSRCQEIGNRLLNFCLVAKFDLAFGQNFFA